MKTFGDFLISAQLEKKAGIESFDDDARKPLDEQLRLGSVAGPLVCTQSNKKEATFKLHPSIPFDWGKLKTDGAVHPVKPGEVLRYHAHPPKGTLSPAVAPNTLRKSFFKDTDFNLSPGTTYLFEESHFDGVNQIIDILSACDPTACWPAGLPENAFLTASPEAPAEERALAACLDDRNPVFAVKGPPGTGKTDLLAEVALKLAQAGKKVGIITVSHDAVNNALARASAKLGTGPSNLTLHKHGKDNPSIAGVTAGKLGDSELPAIWGGVLAAASQMFEKDGKNIILTFKHGTCDVLLLDEAGQIPAYEAAALSHLAGRMILFGDEDQILNITKSSHPPGSHGDSSAMQYLRQALGPEWTIPLETSHRMNSKICGLIQRHFYPDIALKAGKNGDSHLLENGTPFPSLIKDAFRHKSPRLSRSQEEVARVVDWVKRLLAMQVVLEDHAPRPMTTGDIAILTPFRTQASAIRQAIDKDAAIPAPEKLRIGTVDKMQGQGAAAVIYSMASSSKDYIANQAEWLFSHNRWNVAISRAHACAIVLGDIEAHLNAEPKSLDGIAAQQKIREVMGDGAWNIWNALPKESEKPGRIEAIGRLIEGSASKKTEAEGVYAILRGDVLELEGEKFISVEIRNRKDNSKYLLLNEGFRYRGKLVIASSIPYPTDGFAKLLQSIQKYDATFHKRGSTKFGNLPRKKPVLEAYENGHIGFADYMDRIKEEYALVLCFKNPKFKPTIQTITLMKSEIGRLGLFLPKYQKQLQ